MAPKAPKHLKTKTKTKASKPQPTQQMPPTPQRQNSNNTDNLYMRNIYRAVYDQVQDSHVSLQNALWQYPPPERDPDFDNLLRTLVARDRAYAAAIMELVSKARDRVGKNAEADRLFAEVARVRAQMQLGDDQPGAARTGLFNGKKS